MSTTFTSIDPTTGETIATYDAHAPEAIEAALAAAASQAGRWRTTPLEVRCELLRAVADQLDGQRDSLARLMVSEMGKTVAAAGSEIDKCAWVCRHYADHGGRYLERDIVATDASASYVRFDPLGPVLAVMPWNFPFWQLFRAAAPAVTAGNPVLLKHAANVPGCALAIHDVFGQAGAPDGLFQTLLVSSDDVAGLIADPRVRGVTLTGSVEAGRAVGEAAGRHLKPSVLELGGSDAFVVLPDADLERATTVAAASRLLNNGQSCISAKRFIVVDTVADQFVEMFAAEMAQATIGDPSDEATTLGPLAREDLRDDLGDQVKRTVEAGGLLVTGGHPVDRAGWFYPPTVLDRVTPKMAAGAEETFGPAAAVLRAQDEAAAIALANASDLGLGASVWTSDLERGERVAAELDAGCVFVNELVKSDPRVPFGGVKDSGYGRELGSYGIREFVNAKTVWVA